MRESNDLYEYAKRLGWQLLRNGKRHPIWVSPSGKKMSLPKSPGGGRTIENLKAKLRRYA